MRRFLVVIADRALDHFLPNECEQGTIHCVTLRALLNLRQFNDEEVDDIISLELGQSQVVRTLLIVRTPETP